MAVSGSYSGWHYDRTNNRLDFYFKGTRVGHISSTGMSLAATGLTLPTSLATGYIPLPLTAMRVIGASADISNTATNAGGILAKNTDPILERVNGATDKALRVTWAANSVIEAQFPSFVYPPDLDDTLPVLVNLVLAKNTATNTLTNLAISYFESVGDTNAGTSTAAISVSTLATYSVTIAASDVGASPAVATIGVTPAAHANDALYLYGAYVTYTRKVV